MKKNLLTLILGILVTQFSNAQSTDKIVVSNNFFAFDIFREVIKNDTNNVFISPLSISSALSMTYDGAAGNTAKEMKKVLRFDGNQKQSHADFTALLSYYRKSESDIFKISNAIVAQDNYKFKSSYFKLLENYNALIKTADFRNVDSREEARKSINEWVSDNTNGKIEELLDKSSLDELTRLVLLNAIYFKCEWKYGFVPEKTKQTIFYGLNDSQYVTSFMNSRQKYNYYEDENVRFIEIPYKDDKASMYLIQPAGVFDFDKFCQDFSYEEFIELQKQSTDNSTIDFQMPKFSMSSTFKLKEELKSLGMTDAFTGKANFSKMNGRSDLAIDDIIHQSFIDLNEEGTEAAAATAVVVREKSAPIVKNVSFNRPFIFIIKEKSKNSVLFVGKYVKP